MNHPIHDRHPRNLDEELRIDDSDELFQRLGEDLNDDGGRHAGSLNPKSIVVIGKQWFQNHMPQLRELICRNPLVRSLASPTVPAHETVVLASHIADLIAAHFNQVHPYTLTAIVIRKGLHVMCKDVWSEGEPTDSQRKD